MDKTKFQTLTVQVPCQFGDGLHPLTLVVNREGALLGLRSACDNLDPEIRETARALAGEHNTCCRDVADSVAMAAAADDVDTYEVYSRLRALGLMDVEDLGLIPEIAERVMRRTIRRRETRRARRSHHFDVDLRESSLLEERYDSILAAQFGIPSIRFLSKRTSGQAHSVVRTTERVIATYHGRGIWKIEKDAAERITKAFRRNGTKVCPICGVKKTSAHFRTPRHLKRVRERFEQTLSMLGEKLCRRDV